MAGVLYETKREKPRREGEAAPTEGKLSKPKPHQLQDVLIFSRFLVSALPDDGSDASGKDEI